MTTTKGTCVMCLKKVDLHPPGRVLGTDAGWCVLAAMEEARGATYYGEDLS